SRLTAPRTLNDPVTCRFSSFSHSWPPICRESRFAGRTGVSRANPSTAEAALRTSSAETTAQSGSAQRRPGRFADRAQVVQAAARLVGDAALDQLTTRGIERDLPGAEQEPVRHDTVRISADRGRRAV